MRGRKYTSQNREKYGTLERNQTAAERAAENKSEKNIRGMKMDGKNREEQENGAKVRDLEEYKAENRKRKRRRRITVGILAGAILAAGIEKQILKSTKSCVLFRDMTQYRQQRPRTPIRICFRNPEIRSCVTVSTASNCATGKIRPSGAIIIPWKIRR